MNQLDTLRRVIGHMASIESLGYTCTVTEKTATTKSKRKPPAKKSPVAPTGSSVITASNPQGKLVRTGYKKFEKKVRRIMAENGCTFSAARSLLMGRKRLKKGSGSVSLSKKLSKSVKRHWDEVREYAAEHNLPILEAQTQLRLNKK